MATKSKAKDEDKTADAAATAESTAVDKSAVVKAVNEQLKELTTQLKEETQDSKAELAYGPYKSEDIMKLGEPDGGSVKVVMRDYRKFTVAVS